MMTDILDRLQILADEDIITAIDLEFGRFLQEINSDIKDSVLLAAVLTSQAYHEGNVCIYLEDYAGGTVFKEAKELWQVPKLEQWMSALKESKVAGRPGDFRPLILDEAGRLYLHRLWHFEQNLVHQILVRTQAHAPVVDKELLADGLGRLFNNDLEIDWQKVAVVLSLYQLFSVISGGPGTGKTTTVIRLMAMLLEQGASRDALPSIALCAPTGKAAARLETSVQEAISTLSTDDMIKEAIPRDAVTIHQLLGARRNTTRFRYDKDNKLPYDCIIIDEVSMVDQVLMSRLMDALRSDTRLIMLGDKDQLASVEAGSVLGDICRRFDQNQISAAMQQRLREIGIDLPRSHITPDPKPLTDHIVLLQKSYRFGSDSGIARLSGLVNRGEAQQAIELLQEGTDDIVLHSFEEYEMFEDALYSRIHEQFKKVRAAEIPLKKLEAYNEYKILAAHRRGPWGVETINRRMEKRLQRESIISPYDPWYEGRPIIINANNYALGLSNGDIGICVRDERGEQLKVCFNTDDGLLLLSPSRLPDFDLAFSLTIHKSQGSEFSEISVVLPDRASPLLSRELLYTAITRARKKVEIIAPSAVVHDAISNKIARNSGLADHIWNKITNI